MIKIIPFFLAFILASTGFSQPVNDSVFYLGEYDNYEFSEEHQSGFAIAIWNSGSKLIGIIYSSAGLIGDTPRGKILNGKYDKKARKIKFSSKLSEGMISENEPSKDYYEFEGNIRSGKINVQYRHIDSSSTNYLWTQDSAILIPSSEKKFKGNFKNEKEWERNFKAIYEAYGPRW